MKDRPTYLNPTTVRAVREYLAMRVQTTREDYLFADVRGRPVKPRHLVQILPSAEANLPPTRGAPS